ncbi:hypothetical protein PGT21_036978 [Puccinia graminis f. sp. tritici]|uniref:Uncharacterized protein n=1 Tax=Puccinia graminis f. sp. tritici TaxID=56615 RepID=A0A5B0QD71_PUCGR|nr:hypothetical protein PGT21_036978 [Puccinia graminis f. sp. tritici]
MPRFSPNEDSSSDDFYSSSNASPKSPSVSSKATGNSDEDHSNDPNTSDDPPDTNIFNRHLYGSTAESSSFSNSDDSNERHSDADDKDENDSCSEEDSYLISQIYNHRKPSNSCEESEDGSDATDSDEEHVDYSSSNESCLEETSSANKNDISNHSRTSEEDISVSHQHNPCSDEDDSSSNQDDSSSNKDDSSHSEHHLACSDDDDPLTSDYSEYSGSDDEDDDFVQQRDSDSDSSNNSSGGASTSNSEKKILQKLLALGHRGPQIIKILKQDHGVIMSLRTLSRKRKLWNLRAKDLQKLPPPPLSPPIRASILSSHAKGLNLVEIQARLLKEAKIDVCTRTVKRYLRRLGVKLLVNDVAEGNVTMERVFEAVEHARNSLLHDNTGYRRMRTILMRQYEIRIPRYAPVFPPLQLVLAKVPNFLLDKWFTMFSRRSILMVWPHVSVMLVFAVFIKPMAPITSGPAMDTIN